MTDSILEDGKIIVFQNVFLGNKVSKWQFLLILMEYRGKEND